MQLFIQGHGGRGRDDGEASTCSSSYKDMVEGDVMTEKLPHAALHTRTWWKEI